MSEDRDPVITKALNDLRVPDHGAGFWERLEAQIDPSSSMATTDVDADGGEDGLDLPAIVALHERSTHPRRGLRAMAVAAAVVAMLAVAATLTTDDGRDLRLRTAETPEMTDGSTSPTLSGPVVTSAPPAQADADTPKAAVLRWLDAVGAGNTKAAGALTGPRSVAYIRALGANLDGFLLEAGEGYGGWADVVDRSTTEIELTTIGDTRESITIVVVSGTWKGEGPDGYRTDAIPATRSAGGTWTVEPFAFDADRGGRLDIVSPRPSDGEEGGFDGLAGDAVLEVAAPGNGTFHFSLDDQPATAVPGRRTPGQGGVRATFDPPGNLQSRTHLFVVAYVDGATITAFAGTFAVES